MRNMGRKMSNVHVGDGEEKGDAERGQRGSVFLPDPAVDRATKEHLLDERAHHRGGQNDGDLLAEGGGFESLCAGRELVQRTAAIFSRSPLRRRKRVPRERGRGRRRAGRARGSCAAARGCRRASAPVRAHAPSRTRWRGRPRPGRRHRSPESRWAPGRIDRVKRATTCRPRWP